MKLSKTPKTLLAWKCHVGALAGAFLISTTGTPVETVTTCSASNVYLSRLIIVRGVFHRMNDEALKAGCLSPRLQGRIMVDAERLTNLGTRDGWTIWRRGDSNERNRTGEKWEAV